MSEHIDWPQNLEDLCEKTRKEILPEWRESRHDSRREYPSARWLRNHGYSRLRGILRESHDLGLSDFFETILNMTEGGSGYDWDIDDPVTIKKANKFLNKHKDSRGFKQTTLRTYRSSLNSVFQYFVAHYGDVSLVGIANDPDRGNEVYELFEDLFIHIQEMHPDGTAHAYFRILQRFYEWLCRRDAIEYNPVEGLEEEFNFDPDANPTPLSDEQVRLLWAEAETLKEYVLVVGYVFWGLRTGELARIRINQFILEAEDPRYEFERRKNGPGTVSVECGLMYVAERFERRQKHSCFDGDLFDDDKKTLKRKFSDLAKRAGVTIEGDSANPEHGRNYWLDIRSEAHLMLLEAVKDIIPDRGSKDPKTALDSYTDDKTRRKYRRLVLRHHMDGLLEDEAPIWPGDYLADVKNQSTIEDYLRSELKNEFDA